MTLVNNTFHENTAVPPEGRLWTASDLSLFFGVKSVGDLIKRHADFPSPLPLHTRDRRWRPCDVIAWTDRLASRSRLGEVTINIPEFDISSISDLLQEA